MNYHMGCFQIEKKEINYHLGMRKYPVPNRQKQRVESERKKEREDIPLTWSSKSYLDSFDPDPNPNPNPIHILYSFPNPIGLIF